ncbi:uncharacterized protein [Chanodichthys erythropterus]|uniref:uncharacterized protein isoform X1 n=1 Tax=Chanodichthys erythropterus TaxID=933992 RepID=UPI00351E6E88
MEKGYEILSNNTYTNTVSVNITDESECFICRDVGLVGEDPLRTFCDCKSLVAHHSCLLTWIKKGLGREERLSCSICKAERDPEKLHMLYQLQRCAPWRTVASQWQTWPILAIAVLLLALVPYVVYRMMTAFENPPPHSLFKSAAICFGLLSEALLIKCLCSYFSHRLQRAEQSSFSLQPRRSEEHEVQTNLRQCATAGVKGWDSPAVAVERNHLVVRRGSGPHC